MKAPQKLLKSNTDFGHQYIDFVQMFEKKLKNVTINSNSHKHLLNEYRSLRFNHHPIPFYDSQDLTVYGSFENSNIHAVSLESTEQLLEINVLLSSDTNTNGCTQWFYFGIKCHKPQKIKIRILNNRRAKSLLTKNNHIHVFDEGKWQTDCVQDLYYYRTNINHPFYHHEDQQIANLQTNISLYTLEFTYNFKQSDSIVYFALALPYTVKKLYKFLDTCTLKRKSICQTQLGLPVFRLKTKIKTQEVIVILARQHPSETVSSWICQEVIRLLQQGHAIQEKYRFIIYPMVNPDGVFIGNSRCNFNGLDLNRKWDYPNQSTEPEVFYIAKQLKKYKIAFLLDLHGHSKKQNQFIYGCTNQIKHISDYMRVKQFSKLLAQNNQIFNYKDCSFSVTPDKFSTARIAMWKKLKIPNSMTIETSLYGYNNKPFQTHDFQSMALNILNALSKFDATEEDQHLFDATEIHKALTLIKKDIFEEKDKESGSDSEAEQDIIIHRPPRMKVTSRRDSTPTHLKYQKVLSKPKIPEAPIIQHQPSVFFRSNEHTYSFKRIPTKKVQVQKMQKIRSRMNSFQSQFIEEQKPLPNIHLVPRTNIKGAIDLIQAIQVKSLFK